MIRRNDSSAAVWRVNGNMAGKLLLCLWENCNLFLHVEFCLLASDLVLMNLVAKMTEILSV